MGLTNFSKKQTIFGDWGNTAAIFRDGALQMNRWTDLRYVWSKWKPIWQRSDYILERINILKRHDYYINTNRGGDRGAVVAVEIFEKNIFAQHYLSSLGQLFETYWGIILGGHDLIRVSELIDTLKRPDLGWYCANLVAHFVDGLWAISSLNRWILFKHTRYHTLVKTCLDLGKKP